MLATMRKPSHLLSKIQSGSSKGPSVRVANMGCRRLGSLDSRGMDRSMTHRNDESCSTDTKPRRVQLKRSKGWRMPANTVKVDRTTVYGNPFSIKDYGHARAVALHRAWITGAAVDAEPASL